MGMGGFFDEVWVCADGRVDGWWVGWLVIVFVLSCIRSDQIRRAVVEAKRKMFRGGKIDVRLGFETKIFFLGEGGGGGFGSLS